MAENARRLPRHLAHDLAVRSEGEDRLAHVIEEIAQAFSGRFQALLAVGDGVAHGVERAAELTDFVARLDVDARIEFSFFRGAALRRRPSREA